MDIDINSLNVDDTVKSYFHSLRNQTILLRQEAETGVQQQQQTIVNQQERLAVERLAVERLTEEGNDLVRAQQATIEQQLLLQNVLPLQPTQSPAAMLPRNVKAPALSSFKGSKEDDLHAWLLQVEEYFLLFGIHEDSLKIMLAGSAFQGYAKTWYASVRGPHILDHNKIRDWDTFVQALTSHFSPMDPVKLARDKLAALRQFSSVRDYTAQFRYICSAITDIADGEKLDRFVRGLKHHIMN